MSFLLAAASDFDPSHEFELKPWIDLQVGPLDLSVNKAVAYLWLGGLVTILFGIWVMRFGLSLRPDRRQTTGESIYELIQGQIAEGNLPRKAIGMWFPYVASLFLFIWILNLVGFIPLPLSDEKWHVFGTDIPTWGIYAATANLSVTLALAFITFFATHVEGIRYNGASRYFKSWILNLVGFIPLPLSDEKWHVFGTDIPTWGIYAATANLSVTLALAFITFFATHVEGIRYNGASRYFKSWIPAGAPKPLLGLIVPLEVISQFMRLISLSVRLFANMLAGHMLILVMIGLIFIFSAWWLVPFSIAFGTVIYIFEVAIVVTIQAFVFALLSAIYIGSAIEPEH